MVKWLNKWYMVNDKMVNGFMEKKLYNAPLMEVSQINLSSCILDGSPTPDPDPVIPIPPLGPGAPKRRTPVF